MDLLSIRWRRPRRSQDVPEHNQYPVTPAVVNLYPAWRVQIDRIRKLTNRRLIQEHNIYPLVSPQTVTMDSWYAIIDNPVIPKIKAIAY